MRKIFCLLVVLLGLVAIGNAQGTLVKNGKFRNQTSVLVGTIVTPDTDGLFRLSVYATITTADTSSNSNWQVNFYWTDDSGVQQQAHDPVLTGYSNRVGQFDGPFGVPPEGGVESVFEAKAGTPITFDVIQQGSPDRSAYSFYYTLERLE